MGELQMKRLVIVQNDKAGVVLLKDVLTGYWCAVGVTGKKDGTLRTMNAAFWDGRDWQQASVNMQGRLADKLGVEGPQARPWGAGPEAGTFLKDVPQRPGLGDLGRVVDLPQEPGEE